jgi:hypothetical protein
MGLKGLITKDCLAVNYRATYQSQIADIVVRGKLEQRLPHLDWKRIWNNMLSLPPLLKDLMFRVYHDVLPTRVRQKKLKICNEETCQECGDSPENVIHLFLTCRKRSECLAWLRTNIHDMGFSFPDPENFLYFDMTHNENVQKAYLMISMYVNLIWTYRKRRKIPKDTELTRNWMIIRNWKSGQ